MLDPEFKKRFLLASNTKEARIKKSHRKEKHPKWRGGPMLRSCLACGAPFTVPAYRIASGNGKYCSEKCSARFRKLSGECRIPRQPLKCQICGLDFTTKRANEKNHGKGRRFCSRRCVAIYRLGLLTKRKSSTRLERELEALLESICIRYKKQKALLGITVADFFVEPNFALYADGAYWHSRAEVVKRDARINDSLKKAGYHVLRFNEEMIYKKPDKVKEELKICLL